MPTDLRFLPVDVVIEMHQELIARYGGSDGIRDMKLLESAAAQPRATYGGEFLHEDLSAMAAAYLFHIVKNHPFIDGNKRVGLQAALAFLGINGHPIGRPSSELYDATMAVARGDLSKGDVAALFRRITGDA